MLKNATKIDSCLTKHFICMYIYTGMWNVHAIITIDSFHIIRNLSKNWPLFDINILIFILESDNLQQDLQKVEQLEEKINTELVMLREKNATMERDLVTYSDLEKLKQQSEEKKKVISCWIIVWQHVQKNGGMGVNELFNSNINIIIHSELSPFDCNTGNGG